MESNPILTYHSTFGLSLLGITVSLIGNTLATVVASSLYT